MAIVYFACEFVHYMTRVCPLYLYDTENDITMALVGCCCLIEKKVNEKQREGQTEMGRIQKNTYKKLKSHLLQRERYKRQIFDFLKPSFIK